jgi:pantetheine-phosphate adenylyltransferase
MTPGPYVYLAASVVKEISSLGGDVDSLVPPPVREALLLKFR